MTNPSVQNKISDILAKRRPTVRRIEKIEAQLNEITHLITEIDQRRHGHADSLSDEQMEKLRAVDITKLHHQMGMLNQDLQKLKARFSRETLNIGVVGRARQGKSRLLRSLTGLSSQEIPDSDRGHCTGARSTICHTSTDQPYADVYFYTETEFLQEVIRPYFIDLQQNQFSPPPPCYA